MISSSGLLNQLVVGGHLSKCITGVPFTLIKTPKNFCIKSKLFLRASIICISFSIVYLYQASYRVWSHDEESYTRKEDQYYVVIEFLLGMSFMLDFHFCMIPYWQHGEGENLLNEILKVDERHFNSESNLGLSPQEKKIVALTRFVFFIVIHTLIRAVPLLATIVSALEEGIPLNVFHCPPLSFVMSTISTGMTSMRVSPTISNVIRHAVSIAGNLFAWEHLIKFGSVSMMKVILESVSLTLFLLNLRR